MSGHYRAAAQVLSDIADATQSLPDGVRVRDVQDPPPPWTEVYVSLAQAHGTLAVQEELEVVAEQLRRLADVGEALLLLLQPLADRAAAAGVDQQLIDTSEPCAVMLEDGGPCTIARSLHGSVRSHEWSDA